MKDGFFDIEMYVRGVLEDIEPIVNGDERPSDLMDCGYVDGTWDALINLLDNMGIEHAYKKTYTT